MDQLNSNSFGKWFSNSTTKHLRIVDKILKKLDITTQNNIYNTAIRMSDLVNTTISPISSPINATKEQMVVQSNYAASKTLNKNLNISTSTTVTLSSDITTKVVNNFTESKQVQNDDLINDPIEKIIPDNMTMDPYTTEMNVKELINKSSNYPPIMGKTALLSKFSKKKLNKDHEIVRNLVHDRFVVNLYESSTTNPNKIFDEPTTNSKSNRVSVIDNNFINIIDKNETSVNCSEHSSNFEKKCDEAITALNNCIAQYDSSHPSSANTSDASVLISNCSEKSLNLTHSNQSSSGVSSDNNSSSTIISSNSSNIEFNNSEQDDKRASLIQDAHTQRQIMRQTSNALMMCKTTKEFLGSEQQIECEKILLLTTIKRKSILDTIQLLEQEDVDYDQANINGNIKISNICIEIKSPSKGINKNNNNNNKLSTDWYICILSCGLKVFATKVKNCNEAGQLKFEESFEFDHLPTDFEIILNVYHLQIKNILKNYSHEPKFQLNQKKSRCPSTHMLKKDFNSFLNRTNNSEEKEAKRSSFQLLGTLPIHINDVKRHAWKFRLTSSHSTLKETVKMELKSSVTLGTKLSGFLTIGNESKTGVTNWSRKWCVMDNANLKYWNYPSEEGISAPLGKIELDRCANSWIALTNRTLCARPRTLLLETYKDPKYTLTQSSVISNNTMIVKHFLAADNIEEMNFWQKEFNYVVSALRNWNCMQVRL